MRNVVSVWTRWGDYVLGVRDLGPAEALSFGALSAGQSVTVERDGLRYWVTCSEVDEAASFAPPRRWLLPVGGAAVIGALVAVLALLFVPRTPVTAPAPHLALAPNGLQQSAVSPENLPVYAEVFAEAAEPQPQPLKPPGDMRCGRAEMGALVAETRGRYELAGPKDNVDPHMARPVAEVGYPTATGTPADMLQPQTQPGSRGPTVPFGRDAALGTDETNALGTMWGDEVADATGDDGLGLVATPGGVVKRIALAAVAENAAALRVVHTGLRVSGARKASEIGRAMAAHFEDFRRCAAASALGEARRVELDFDVATDGHASTTPANATALEQCLDQSVSLVSFAADANAPAHVVYPLYFIPATTALRPPPPAQHRPAPCDCGG